MAGTNGVIAKTPFAVTITTVATQIRAANGLRRTLSLRNNGVATVYLGNSSAVTTSTGYPLETGDAVDEDQAGDAWWGRARLAAGPGPGRRWRAGSARRVRHGQRRGGCQAVRIRRWRPVAALVAALGDGPGDGPGDGAAR